MTPTEFKNMKRERWLPAAKRVIDRAMIRHTSGDIKIGTHLFEPGTKFDELLGVYRSDGWDCRLEYDERDGDFLVFKEPV